MIMGMSAETFWGGAEGNAAFEDDVRERSGLDVTTGASATRVALELYGARRIAVGCPYPPVGVEHVSRFYVDHGFEVVDAHGFASQSPAAMAQITDDDLRPVLDRFAQQGVDAIVQAGTNLSMLRLAASVEHHLDLPVIPINGACVWDALRRRGIRDQPAGRGRLFERH
jgi:maleate isomerase